MEACIRRIATRLHRCFGVGDPVIMNTTEPVPLNIHLIVALVCRYLGENDLLNVRAVSQLWKSEATREYGRRRNRSLELGEGALLRMKTAIAIIPQPKWNLIVPSRIHITEFFFEDNEDGAEFQNTTWTFLNRIADFVEELKLEIDHPSLPIVNQFKLQPCPKLRTLFLSCYLKPEPAQGVVDLFFNLAESLLTQSPVLKNLSLHFADNLRFEGASLGTLMPANDIIIRLSNVISKIPSSVHNLTLNVFDAFQSLGVLQLPNLQFLAAPLLLNSDMVRVFMEAFNNGKNTTLKALDLSFYRGGPSFDFEFPYFPNLKSLTIDCYLDVEGSENRVLQFSSYFPKLTRLSIVNPSSTIFQNLFPDGFSAPKIQSCRVAFFRDVDLHKLVSGFSALTSLEVFFPDFVSLEHNPELSDFRSGFLIISERLVGLQKLRLILSGNYEPNYDSILTGIPPEACQAIAEAQNWEDIDLAALRTHRGLSNFNQMVELRVGIFGIGDDLHFDAPTHLTDVTAYLGYLKMEKLRNLTTNEFRFSETCQLKLRKHFGKNLRIQDPGRYTRLQFGEHFPIFCDSGSPEW